MSARTWQAGDGVIPTDWAQLAMYGGPVIAPTIEALISRISLFTVRGATVLHLWDSSERVDLTRTVEAVGLAPDTPVTAAVSPASRLPVETGYLECVHLVSSSVGAHATDAITTFMSDQRTRYPDVEAHLRACYGRLSAEQAADPRFRGIDYDAFDLGPIRLGFGLFAQRDGHRHVDLWCWSRVINWHK